jgi:ATP-dependent DNA helicase RecG
MRPNSKNDVMERFYRHEIDVLVSTTVIEVGVNVPNATLMIIEGADRFGLSQLHQLRGRVARGSHECFCVLVSDSSSDEATNRLQTLVEHSSGFDVAEEDFKQRGPGDLFSVQKSGNIRQSGEFGFKYGEFCDNEQILHKAYADAEAVLNDSDSDETKKLLAHLEKYASGALTE